MSLVIDASVALKWVLDETGGEAASALLDEELIAPPLWLVEAANALWRRAQRGEISADGARERLAELFNAIRENTQVVTADRRFVTAVDRSPTYKSTVRLLGGLGCAS